MPQTITRKIEFDAGHRVLGHEGQCANLHGHRYVAEITVAAPELDEICRVIDFSVVKDQMKGWIDANWDHNFLVNSKDPLLNVSNDIFNGRPPYIIPHSENPTAEVMAKILFKRAKKLLPDTIDVLKVRLYETPNCWAEYDFIEECSRVVKETSNHA